MVVLAQLLVAEARLWSHGWLEASALLRRAEEMMTAPEVVDVHAEGIRMAWPYNEAMERINRTRAWLDTSRQELSADLVLPHCREDLSWLGDGSLDVLPLRTQRDPEGIQALGHREDSSLHLREVWR